MYTNAKEFSDLKHCLEIRAYFDLKTVLKHVSMCENGKFLKLTIYNRAARIHTVAFEFKKLVILLIIYLFAPHKSSMYSLWNTVWKLCITPMNFKHMVPHIMIHVNPLSPELNPICYLLALLRAHHFLHVSRIRVKLLTFRRQMSYIYIYIYIWSTILDVSRSHTTTQHSR